MIRDYTNPSDTFCEIIDQFNYAILTNTSLNEDINSRPVSIEGFDNINGNLFLLTNMLQTDAKEFSLESKVKVSMQSSSDFLVLSGTAKFINDLKLIEMLSEDSWVNYSSEKSNSDDLIAIQFYPNAGQYWELQKNKKISFVWK